MATHLIFDRNIGRKSPNSVGWNLNHIWGV